MLIPHTTDIMRKKLLTAQNQENEVDWKGINSTKYSDSICNEGVTLCHQQPIILPVTTQFNFGF